jgi:hypothetical protein
MSAAVAETVVVDDKVAVRESSVARPKGGMLMSAVEQKFGAPVTRHPAVGQPPITRWDYPSFAVFFEKDRVIHAVVTGDAGASAPSAPGAPAAPSTSASVSSG